MSDDATHIVCGYHDRCCFQREPTVVLGAEHDRVVRLQHAAGVFSGKPRQGGNLPEEELTRVARLIGERQLHMIEIAKLTAELALARAALERIRDFYEPGQEGETTHQDIARRALERE
jgi:hypothetical protein